MGTTKEAGKTSRLNNWVLASWLVFVFCLLETGEWVLHHRFSVFLLIAYGILIPATVAANHYANTRWLGRKLNPQQRAYVDRMVMTHTHLRQVKVELESANELWSQPNMQRALRQTEKALEVWHRRMKRLHRETKNS